VDQFRKRRRDGDARESRCRDCHAAYMRSYRREHRERLLNAFARETKWRANETTLTALSAAMIRKFGGMENFVREWHEQTIRMTGSKAALDSYQCIMRLMQAAARQQVKRDIRSRRLRTIYIV
jgi:hypothetical protein